MPGRDVPRVGRLDAPVRAGSGSDVRLGFASDDPGFGRDRRECCVAFAIVEIARPVPSTDGAVDYRGGIQCSRSQTTPGT